METAAANDSCVCPVRGRRGTKISDSQSRIFFTWPEVILVLQVILAIETALLSMNQLHPHLKEYQSCSDFSGSTFPRDFNEST